LLREIVKKFTKLINDGFFELILKGDLSVEEWVFAREKFPQVKSIDYEKVKI